MVAHQSWPVIQAPAAGTTGPTASLGTVSELPAPSVKLTFTLIVSPSSAEAGE